MHLDVQSLASYPNYGAIYSLSTNAFFVRLLNNVFVGNNNLY